MTKKETLWRHILEEARGHKKTLFTQKDLASTFHYSTSTVFNALKVPRKLGAIEVTGRFFRLRDAEKLLLLWATVRDIKKDIIYETVVDMPPQAIEGLMPPDVIFGAFSAYRLLFKELPADYDKVMVYASDPKILQKRFPMSDTKKTPNVMVLKPDPLLSMFGKTTPLSQIFVDLWNRPEWYAKDFISALKKHL